MRYKIIGDSCLDLTKEMRKDPCYSMIPLTLMVGERHFVDDETFDQKEFIKASKGVPGVPEIGLSVSGDVQGGVLLRGRERVCDHSFRSLKRKL